MRTATRAEAARNTRAVASQRSMRRISLGSAGACVLPKKRCFASTCKSSRTPVENGLVTHRNVSHSIENKDREQAKLCAGPPLGAKPGSPCAIRAPFFMGYFRNPSLLESRSKMAARIFPLRHYSKLWTAAVAACLATLVLAALILPQSFRLTALSDIVQCLLLFSGALSLIPHIVRSSGRLRLFWTLITTGITFWFSYQLVWTYFEVWMRVDVPDLCAADMILFLHIVPLLAALALRPHATQEEYAARLRRLDFALMVTWWMYLYVLFVLPWPFVMARVAAFNNNLNSLYLFEKLAFLSMLFLAWIDSKGGWKAFYAGLFGASITYAASSHIANWAIERHAYYSGSLYDIPLAVSMAWITVIGLSARERE